MHLLEDSHIQKFNVVKVPVDNWPWCSANRFANLTNPGNVRHFMNVVYFSSQVVKCFNPGARGRPVISPLLQ